MQNKRIAFFSCFHLQALYITGDSNELLSENSNADLEWTFGVDGEIYWAKTMKILLQLYYIANFYKQMIFH